MNEKQVYLATDAGFEIYDLDSGSFLFFGALDDDSASPAYYRANPFCIDHAGKVWMGGPDGGLRYYDPREGRVLEYPIKTEKGAVNGMPLKIMEGQDSALWILDSLHLWRLPPDRSRLEQYAARPVDMGVANGQDEPRFLYEGQGGSVWIGTPEVLRFDPREAFFRFFQFFNTD